MNREEQREAALARARLAKEELKRLLPFAATVGIGLSAMAAPQVASWIEVRLYEGGNDDPSKLPESVLGVEVRYRTIPVPRALNQ